MQLFDRYGMIFGKKVSNDKCSVLFGKHIIVYRRQNSRVLTFYRGPIGIHCHGAPIFKGKPNSYYFKKIYDKGCSQFARWKGKCLSMEGKDELVKLVIQAMTVYTMLIYRWPNSLLYNSDMLSKKFICSGDVHKVTLTIMCKTVIEGGLAFAC